MDRTITDIALLPDGPTKEHPFFNIGDPLTTEDLLYLYGPCIKNWLPESIEGHKRTLRAIEAHIASEKMALLFWVLNSATENPDGSITIPAKPVLLIKLLTQSLEPDAMRKYNLFSSKQLQDMLLAIW